MQWRIGLLAIFSLFTFALATSRSSFADTVELYGSGQVAGKVLKDEPNGKPAFVLLQLDQDLKIAIPKSRVQRVTTADELAEYRGLAGRVGDDPEKHYQLARWCEGNGLSHQSRYHMKRTVAIDPNHSRARAALGFVENKGKWVLFADQKRNEGMISVGGRWKLPEAVARERMQQEADVTAKRWIKDIARWRTTVLRGGKKAGESLEAIKAIKDPLAAQAVAKELSDSRGKSVQPRSLRLIWVDLLGSFQNLTAVAELTRAGVEEPDDVVRERSLDYLQQYGASSAVATYLPMLNPKKYKHEQVTKALRALSFFPDRELAMQYIDALVTSHKKEVTPAGNMSIGIGNDGSGGLGIGNNKKVIIEQKRNPGALTLLKMIEPGVDFGFDKQAWREHFAGQLTAFEGNLRRDP